jgi:hypothetical protein
MFVGHEPARAGAGFSAARVSRRSLCAQDARHDAPIAHPQAPAPHVGGVMISSPPPRPHASGPSPDQRPAMSGNGASPRALRTRRHGTRQDPPARPHPPVRERAGQRPARGGARVFHAARRRGRCAVSGRMAAGRQGPSRAHPDDFVVQAAPAPAARAKPHQARAVTPAPRASPRVGPRRTRRGSYAGRSTSRRIRRAERHACRAAPPHRRTPQRPSARTASRRLW